MRARDAQREIARITLFGGSQSRSTLSQSRERLSLFKRRRRADFPRNSCLRRVKRLWRKDEGSVKRDSQREPRFSIKVARRRTTGTMHLILPPKLPLGFLPKEGRRWIARVIRINLSPQRAIRMLSTSEFRRKSQWIVVDNQHIIPDNCFSLPKACTLPC